jgi:hypothetical protein
MICSITLQLSSFALPSPHHLPPYNCNTGYCAWLASPSVLRRFAHDRTILSLRPPVRNGARTRKSRQGTRNKPSKAARFHHGVFGVIPPPLCTTPSFIISQHYLLFSIYQLHIRSLYTTHISFCRIIHHLGDVVLHLVARANHRTYFVGGKLSKGNTVTVHPCQLFQTFSVLVHLRGYIPY